MTVVALLADVYAMVGVSAALVLMGVIVAPLLDQPPRRPLTWASGPGKAGGYRWQTNS